MLVSTAIANFSRAKIDHNLMGRFDLPIYTSGLDVFRNWISNFQGNALFRTGFEEMLAFQDCAYYEFKFNTTQNYLLLFYLNKIRFAAFDSNGDFGWVLNGGSTPLEVATPYTLAEAKDLQVTQNSDVLIITVQGHPPYELTRTASNVFTMFPQSRKDDPFPLTWASAKDITAITNATQAQFTIVGHGYSLNDRFRVTGVGGMTEINNYTASVVQVVDADNVKVNIDTSDTAVFAAYTSGGTGEKVLTGNYPACCCFYKKRLWYGNTVKDVTRMWGSQSANYKVFTVVTMPVDTDAIDITLTDISSPIAWIFAGDNSLIVGAGDGILAINGGDVNTPITPSAITSNVTTAPGCNSAIPVRKDGYMFYISLDGRNLYYFSYNFLSTRFEAKDANITSYTVSQTGMNKIRWKKDKNDLIWSVRGDGELLSVNFNGDEKIIGWHNHETLGLFQDIAVIPDNNGVPQLIVLSNRGGNFYVEKQRNYVEFAELANFFSGDDQEQEDEIAYTRYVCEQLKQCCYLDNALSLSGLQSNAITYNPTTHIITATNNVFSSGSVGHHIVYKTLTGYESGRFKITGYIDAKNVNVTVLQIPTQNTYTDWYLTFSQVTGLSQYNGQEVAVVKDGGFLAKFTVSGGAIDLGTEATLIWIGYSYIGVIKSFCFGFQNGGKDTQATFKTIGRVGVRVATSAGLKVGSSRYELEEIQKREQGDLNYLPPTPMDGTQYVYLGDIPELDKFLWMVQDLPLPATICAMLLDTDYTEDA